MPGPSLDIYLNFVISIQILVFLNSSIPPKTLLCTNAPNLCINCVFRIQIFVILFTPALAPTSRNYANRNINSDNDNEIWGCECQSSENQGYRVPKHLKTKATECQASRRQSDPLLSTTKPRTSLPQDCQSDISICEFQTLVFLFLVSSQALYLIEACSIVHVGLTSFHFRF